jgi:hypothetical protein
MYFVLIGFGVGGWFARAANLVGKSEVLWGAIGAFSFLIVGFLVEFLMGVIGVGLFPDVDRRAVVTIALITAILLGLLVCLLLNLRFLRGGGTSQANPY